MRQKPEKRRLDRKSLEIGGDIGMHGGRAGNFRKKRMINDLKWLGDIKLAEDWEVPIGFENQEVVYDFYRVASREARLKSEWKVRVGNESRLFFQTAWW